MGIMIGKSRWILLPIVFTMLSFIFLVTDLANLKGLQIGLRSSHVSADEANPLKESFCCCSVDEISDGTEGILELLNNITRRPFFRYFKVSLDKPCPYWAVQLLCTAEENACQVCSCDDNDVPESLRYPYDMSDPMVTEGRISHDEPNPINIDFWGAWNNSEDDLSYVDLYQNPEGNTGYTGPMAARVWQAIYKENCMIEPREGGMIDDADSCMEEQVFRKLISGLHTSIGMHVAAFFYKDKEGLSPLLKTGVIRNPNISFFPNCPMYERMTKNKEFIYNLYVLYQFVLRAVTKAKMAFLSEIHTLNSGAGGTATPEDQALHSELHELFNAHLLCSKTFDEEKFFESPKAHFLVPQMKRMMMNITTLMDCVTCEKCRAWGKLQTMGISTALKIVMLPPELSLRLSRGEKVSLINLARQLAVSVKNVNLLADVCKDELGKK